jgi:hypothetical protein
MAKYGKSIVAGLFFLWTVVAPLLTGDNRIDGLGEWSVVAVGFSNMLLVYIIPLNPAWEAGKTVINGVLAALAAAQTLLGDGLQPDDWTIIIGAFLTIVIGWYAPTISAPGTTALVRVPAGFNA